MVLSEQYGKSMRGFLQVAGPRALQVSPKMPVPFLMMLIGRNGWDRRHLGPITSFFRRSLGGIFGSMVAVHWETLDVMIWMHLFGPSIYRAHLRFRFTLPGKVIVKLLLMERPALIIFLKGRARLHSNYTGIPEA